LADEQLAELTMLCGFDDDLAAQVTQTSRFGFSAPGGSVGYSIPVYQSTFGW